MTRVFRLVQTPSDKKVLLEGEEFEAWEPGQSQWLFLRARVLLGDEQIHALKDTVQAYFPGRMVMVFDRDIEFVHLDEDTEEMKLARGRIAQLEGELSVYRLLYGHPLATKPEIGDFR